MKCRVTECVSGKIRGARDEKRPSGNLAVLPNCSGGWGYIAVGDKAKGESKDAKG